MVYQYTSKRYPKYPKLKGTLLSVNRRLVQERFLDGLACFWAAAPGVFFARRCVPACGCGIFGAIFQRRNLRFSSGVLNYWISRTRMVGEGDKICLINLKVTSWSNI